MNLYEIDKRITSLIDPESGELKSYDEFESLQMERDEKIENICCWIKDLNAEEQALKNEIDNLTARKRAAGNKREQLKTYLQNYLNGEKFKSPKAVVSYRKTSSVYIPDEAAFKYDCDIKFLRYRDPDIDKEAVKKAIKEGKEVPGAEIRQAISMTVK